MSRQLPRRVEKSLIVSVRRTLDEDRYPLAPRLKPLRAALAKFDPASAPRQMPERKSLPEAPARGRERATIATLIVRQPQ